MKRWVQIIIEAGVPDDQPDLGHEGVVAAKEGAAELAYTLAKLGLAEVSQTRRIMTKKGPRTADHRILDSRQMEIEAALAVAKEAEARGGLLLASREPAVADAA